MSAAAWIAVDWGTSRLRAWLMDAHDQVIEQRFSKAGMAGLEPEQFSGALEALVGAFEGPVVACGMVGSRQGWAEAPYATVPCIPPTAASSTRVGQVHILPGIKQEQPADVMRGEETQIAGYLSANPKFEGVICLPGTHTKWVHVSAGEIVSFRTAMTGELFALLSDHSVLRHSLTDEWDHESFLVGMRDMMTRPAALAAALFNIRAGSLVVTTPPGHERARLSGLLIGAELAAMRPYWLGQAVVLVGAKEISKAYKDALEDLGVAAAFADGDEMTLKGLTAAKAALELTRAVKLSPSFAVSHRPRPKLHAPR